MPPNSGPQVSVATGVTAPSSPQLPSNMVVVGEGVYQITAGVGAESRALAEPGEAVEASSGDSAEARPTGAADSVRADDHGMLQDQGVTCVPDQPVEAHDPARAPDSALAQDESTESVGAIAPPERQSDDPEVRAAATAPPPEQIDPAEAAAPAIVQVGEDDGLNGPGATADRPEVRDTTAAQSSPPSLRGDQATNAQQPAAAAGAPIPCKISVQMRGRPTVETPIFLVQDNEPALRLSSLLDLVRPDLPADEFLRLRRSASAATILSIRDLRTAGFAFEVIDGAVMIGVAV